jgi:hypothetical protein
MVEREGGEAQLNEVKFYNVKTRDFSVVPVSQVKKKIYERKTKSGDLQTRYALRATVDGVNLTTFVKKEVYESLNVPVEN